MELNVFTKTYNLLRSSNDRSAGILAGVIVDDMLKNLLRAVIIEHLSKESLDALFGNNGVLCTLYNKSLVAFAFGLIEEEELRLIDIVRNIRNKCAHNIATNPAEDLSFSESPLIDLIREWIPEKWVNRIPESERKKFIETRMIITADNARSFFDYLVSLISLILYLRVAASQRRLQPPSQLGA